MKDIRIEPRDGRTLLVDVVCDCGANGLVDEATGSSSFKHEVKIGNTGQEDKILACTCGKKYRLQSQTTHVHVFSMG